MSNGDLNRDWALNGPCDELIVPIGPKVSATPTFVIQVSTFLMMIQVCFIMSIIVKRDSSLVGTNDVGYTGILISWYQRCRNAVRISTSSSSLSKLHM